MVISEYIENDPEVSNWWSSVDAEEKQKLMRSWSPESETCTKTLHENQWEDLPIIIVGRLTDVDENPDWNSDLYEFFVNHPEFFISGLPICFHVCSNEHSVRAALKTGVIPNSFNCSGKPVNCVMNPILNIMKGKSLIFKAYRLND